MLQRKPGVSETSQGLINMRKSFKVWATKVTILYMRDNITNMIKPIFYTGKKMKKTEKKKQQHNSLVIKTLQKKEMRRKNVLNIFKPSIKPCNKSLVWGL